MAKKGNSRSILPVAGASTYSCQWLARMPFRALKLYRVRISAGCLLLVLGFTLPKLTVAWGAATTPATPHALEDRLAAIDRFVDRERTDLRLPGLALGIVQGEQIVHLKGFGNAHSAGGNRLGAVTPQTPFMLESISKSFTALAVMQLVEAGKLELDAPVQRYLPWFAVADPTISARMTLRHLLYQTSGLSNLSGNIFMEYGDGSDQALENVVRSLRQVHTQPLGQGYEYSNMNYVILGLIVQTVSGQPFEAYVQQHIFGPLAMQHSYAALAESRRNGLATGYRFWFGQPQAVSSNKSYNRAAAPSGFLSASAEDMTHYLIAQLNGGRYQGVSVLSAAGIETLHRPVATQSFASTYAMGWETETINGVATIWHNGAGTEGFQTHMMLVPAGHWGIVVLVNAIDFLHFQRIDEIAVGVMSLLVDRPLPPTSFEWFRAFFLGILAVGLLQLIGIIRSLRMLRRWRAEPLLRPATGGGLLRYVGLPLLLNLAWVGLIAWIEGGMNPSIVRILMESDLGWTELVSGAVALVWGCLIRPALVFTTLRWTPPVSLYLGGELVSKTKER